jgi:ATP-binding cassette subfamily B protein
VVEAATPRRLAQVRGAIEFDRVTIDLGRGQILQSVSFVVAPGERLAIVGPSGSGKSTVADLLLRLIDPDRGIVRIDGHDVRSISLADLRHHVVLVEQEPCILHATIAENIRYARPDATDAQVGEAARQAALGEFINRLPDGDRTMVGERGLALSAGERQRVGIARAFLANPAVLVLDEPSAALDPASERQIIDGYESVMRGRTAIVITHRSEVARRADRIIELGMWNSEFGIGEILAHPFRIPDSALQIPDS